MPSVTFRVLITGTAADADQSAVRANLAKTFNASPAAVNEIMAHLPYQVKSGLSQALATRYAGAVQAAGATCQIIEDEPLEIDLPPKASSSQADGALENDFADVRHAETSKIRQEQGGVHTPSFSWSDALNMVWLAAGAALLAGGLYILQQDRIRALLAPFRGPNELESVLQIGESRVEAFQAFKLKGALDAESRWKGFKVVSVAVKHRPSGELTEAYLKVYRNFPGHTLASLENFQKALADMCGGEWDINEDQSGMSAQGAKGVQCVVNGAGAPSGPVEVALFQAAPPQAPRPPADVTPLPQAGRPTTEAPSSDAGTLVRWRELHQTKPWVAWESTDAVAAVRILASATGEEARQIIAEAEQRAEQECEAGSCVIAKAEFAAARLILLGKSRSAEEALAAVSKK